jgi:hypothetical protein
VHDGFGHARFQEFCELFRNHRVAEKEALSLAASFLLQEMQLLTGFHAFRNHSMIQAFADVNHGAHSLEYFIKCTAHCVFTPPSGEQFRRGIQMRDMAGVIADSDGIAGA